MFGVISALSSNKIYMENNLLPLQVYYSKHESVLSKLKGGERCVLQKLWRKYEDMIEADNFLNLKVGENSYEMFKYKKLDNNTYRIYLDDQQVGIYDLDELVPKKYITVNKKNVFLGVYPPLVDTICNYMPITKTGVTVSYTEDKAASLIKIWLEVERLRLSIEAMYNEIQTEKQLKM